MTKLLLTTVFRPFGIENKYNKKGDEFLLDYLASRLTREPGLFSLSSYVPHSGLHLIAANLPVETKVLEYPTLEEFVEEVKKGYDYLGITFLIKGFRKVFQMVSLTRKYSPKTKIVIGGFGTCLHNIEDLGADYVCKGEGVSFMRKLLGFSEDTKMINPEITAEITLKVLQDYHFLDKPRIGLVTSGFGCPSACDFCCTSAYFGHKNIPFLKSGEELYKTMLYMHKNTTNNVDHFLIYEEDFMLYEDKVKELGKLIQKDKDNTFTYACFASIKSISNYDLEELVSRGLGHVWIGIESMNTPFNKRKGRDIGEVFQELHSFGVTTTGSAMFGLEHHTPDSLPKEVDFVIALEPSTVQLANLMPGIGTPLRTRLEKEKRIYKTGFKDADLYSEVMIHPNFRLGEMTTAIFTGYERIYNTLGPSIYRILKTWFTGYKNLRKSSSRLIRNKAELYAVNIRGVLPIFLNTCQYLPNDEVRSKVNNTLEEIFHELGTPSAEQVKTGELIGRIFALEDTKRKYLEEIPIEPSISVKNYNSQFFEKCSQHFS